MKNTVRSFEDLEVYRLAEKLALKIYKRTSKFPIEEKYGLANQLRRATLSVGANIAEGFGRYHFKDKIKFLYQARGSLLEVKHFLRFSCKIELISNREHEEINQQIRQIGVKLNNYIKVTYNQQNSY